MPSPSLNFGFICSVMPNRSKILMVCTPLDAPVAGSENVTDLAASNADFSAAGVLMSGCGAPARTATLINERAMWTREPARILPRLIRSSIASGVTTADARLERYFGCPC